MTTEDKILFNYQKCLSEALETSKLEKQNRDHAILKLLKVSIYMYEYKRCRYVILSLLIQFFISKYTYEIALSS